MVTHGVRGFIDALADFDLWRRWRIYMKFGVGSMILGSFFMIPVDKKKASPGLGDACELIGCRELFHCSIELTGTG